MRVYTSEMANVTVSRAVSTRRRLRSPFGRGSTSKPTTAPGAGGAGTLSAKPSKSAVKLLLAKREALASTHACGRSICTSESPVAANVAVVSRSPVPRTVSGESPRGLHVPVTCRNSTGRTAVVSP